MRAFLLCGQQVTKSDAYDFKADHQSQAATPIYRYGELLSFENQKQMLIPRGFTHGYLTLEDDTLMQWCVDNNFCAEAARAVRYDSDFIWQTEPWPVREYILSEKDKNAIKLSELCKF